MSQIGQTLNMKIDPQDSESEDELLKKIDEALGDSLSPPSQTYSNSPSSFIRRLNEVLSTDDESPPRDPKTIKLIAQIAQIRAEKLKSLVVPGNALGIEPLRPAVGTQTFDELKLESDEEVIQDMSLITDKTEEPMIVDEVAPVTMKPPEPLIDIETKPIVSVSDLLVAELLQTAAATRQTESESDDMESVVSKSSTKEHDNETLTVDQIFDALKANDGSKIFTKKMVEQKPDVLKVSSGPKISTRMAVEQKSDAPKVSDALKVGNESPMAQTVENLTKSIETTESIITKKTVKSPTETKPEAPEPIASTSTGVNRFKRKLKRPKTGFRFNTPDLIQSVTIPQPDLTDVKEMSPLVIDEKPPAVFMAQDMNEVKPGGSQSVDATYSESVVALLKSMDVSSYPVELSNEAFSYQILNFLNDKPIEQASTSEVKVIKSSSSINSTASSDRLQIVCSGTSEFSDSDTEAVINCIEPGEVLPSSQESATPEAVSITPTMSSESTSSSISSRSTATKSELAEQIRLDEEKKIAEESNLNKTLSIECIQDNILNSYQNISAVVTSVEHPSELSTEIETKDNPMIILSDSDESAIQSPTGIVEEKCLDSPPLIVSESDSEERKPANKVVSDKLDVEMHEDLVVESYVASNDTAEEQNIETQEKISPLELTEAAPMTIDNVNDTVNEQSTLILPSAENDVITVKDTEIPSVSHSVPTEEDQIHEQDTNDSKDEVEIKKTVKDPIYEEQSMPPVTETLLTPSLKETIPISTVPETPTPTEVEEKPQSSFKSDASPPPADNQAPQSSPTELNQPPLSMNTRRSSQRISKTQPNVALPIIFPATPREVEPSDATSDAPKESPSTSSPVTATPEKPIGSKRRRGKKTNVGPSDTSSTPIETPVTLSAIPESVKGAIKVAEDEEVTPVKSAGRGSKKTLPNKVSSAPEKFEEGVTKTGTRSKSVPKPRTGRRGKASDETPSTSFDTQPSTSTATPSPPMIETLDELKPTPKRVQALLPKLRFKSHTSKSWAVDQSIEVTPSKCVEKSTTETESPATKAPVKSRTRRSAQLIEELSPPLLAEETPTVVETAIEEEKPTSRNRKSRTSAQKQATPYLDLEQEIQSFEVKKITSSASDDVPAPKQRRRLVRRTSSESALDTAFKSPDKAPRGRKSKRQSDPKPSTSKMEPIAEETTGSPDIKSPDHKKQKIEKKEDVSPVVADELTPPIIITAKARNSRSRRGASKSASSDSQETTPSKVIPTRVGRKRSFLEREVDLNLILPTTLDSPVRQSRRIADKSTREDADDRTLAQIKRDLKKERIREEKDADFGPNSKSSKRSSF